MSRERTAIGLMAQLNDVQVQGTQASFMDVNFELILSRPLRKQKENPR